jgi:hypothetical protein
LKKESDIIIYSFIEALGTVLAALSGTYYLGLERGPDLRRGLDITGNALQAAGNALETETISLFADGGNAWTAIGNSVVLAGLLDCFGESGFRKALVSGNLIQALGNLILAGKTLEIGPKTIGQVNFLIGSLLQATGNALQAAGAGKETDHRAIRLVSTGGWVQATGAVLGFISTLQEYHESERVKMQNYPFIFYGEAENFFDFVPYI